MSLMKMSSLRCHNCGSSLPKHRTTCANCGVSVSAQHFQNTAIFSSNPVHSFEPAIEHLVPSELLKLLAKWSVSTAESLYSVRVNGRKYPLPYVHMLRRVVEQKWLPPDASVFDQATGQWYEASHFLTLYERRQTTPKQKIHLADKMLRDHRLEPSSNRRIRIAEREATEGNLGRALCLYEEVVQAHPEDLAARQRLEKLRFSFAQQSTLQIVRPPSKQTTSSMAEEDVLSLDDVIEDDESDEVGLPALQFQDTSNEIHKGTAVVSQKASNHTVESSIEHTLDVLFASSVVPEVVPSQLFDSLTFSHSTQQVDWKELERLFHKAGHLDRERETLQRAFIYSQHVCLVYVNVELIGAARALSDGVACATLCDLVISPRFPQELICSALVGALLEEIDVQRVFLVDGMQYFDSLSSLGFRNQEGVLMRTEDLV